MTYPTRLITGKGKKSKLPRRRLQIHFWEHRVTFQSHTPALVCVSSHARPRGGRSPWTEPGQPLSPHRSAGCSPSPGLPPEHPQSWLPTPLGDDQQGRLQSRHDPRKDLPSMPCSQWREKKHTCGHKEWHSVLSVPLTRPRPAATLCCTHPHESTRTHAMHSRTCTRTYPRAHRHVPTNTHAHICTHTYTYPRTRIRTHKHAHTCIHAHAYTLTRLHAHTQWTPETQKQGARPSQQGARLTLVGSAALAVSPQEASLSPDQTSLAGSRHSHNTSWARKSPAHVIRRNTLGNDSLPWRPARALRPSVPLTPASRRGLGPGWAAASVQSKQWTIVGADVCDSHGSETTALRPPTSKPAGPAEQARGPGGD